MSTDSNFLKTTEDLIETSLEIKSFIHQQIIDFSPFINKQQYNEIVSAAKIMNVKKGESIKILYEAMDSKHDYSVIRIALTIWFKGGM